MGGNRVTMRKFLLSAAILALVAALDPVQAAVVYHDIFPPNPSFPDASVTGIRQDSGPGNPVVITGSYQAMGKPQALLYKGPLHPTDNTGFYPLTPVFPGQTVTTSIFYGPNTPLFDPSIGNDKSVRAVGSYKYTAGGLGDHGMMYQGSLSGGGTWTPINVPDALAGGTVADTIPHSTMGNIVVGNYDLAGVPASGNAFIFNITTGDYTILDIGDLATLYGVWQNGGSASTSYTLTGGYKSGAGLNKGFLLDYDSSSGNITDLTPFSAFNDPGIVTHFENISGVPGGYTLAATTDSGAAFARVDRNAEGSFGPATWVPIADPNSIGITTGNSVIDNNVIGIYQPAGGGIQSYVAAVPEPPTSLLMAIGIGGLALLRFGWRSLPSPRSAGTAPEYPTW